MPISSEALIAAPNTCTIGASPPHLSTEQLTSLFNTICSSILNTVAPLKLKKQRPKGLPWRNDTTRALRRECRISERKLQISFEILRNKYQVAVKAARAKNFSDLISNNSHNPKVLFSTINSFISPQYQLRCVPCKCKEFPNFFINKVEDIRMQKKNFEKVILIQLPHYLHLFETFQSGFKF